jgi:hypothetical protein
MTGVLSGKLDVEENWMRGALRRRYMLPMAVRS